MKPAGAQRWFRNNERTAGEMVSEEATLAGTAVEGLNPPHGAAMQKPRQSSGVLH